MEINVILYPDFETLDALGPVEVLGCIEQYHIGFFSLEGGLIKSKHGVEILTRPLGEAAPGGVLLVPGGQAKVRINDQPFILALGAMAARVAYCLTVCTGSAFLARTSLLDGRRATTNKLMFSWVSSVNSAVKWVEKARWVVDGKFYTASGVSAGMDMALGFIADRLGQEKARKVAAYIEYIWNDDPEEDPFVVDTAKK